MKFIHTLLVTFVALLPASGFAQGYDRGMVFERIGAEHGLSDNNVQCLLPLSDGRMLVQTWRNVNICDGGRIVTVPRCDERMSALPHHSRDYHVCEDDCGRVWIKEWERLWCIDLRTGQQLDHPLALLADGAVDVFFDAFSRSLHYAWRLLPEGEDGEWHDGAGSVDANGCLHLSFMHLRPGRYVFQVAVSDYARHRGTPSALMTIDILPPWWHTLRV